MEITKSLVSYQCLQTLFKLQIVKSRMANGIISACWTLAFFESGKLCKMKIVKVNFVKCWMNLWGMKIIF